MAFPTLAKAEPFTYAPDSCDFKIVFPEKPFIEQKCADKTCSEIVTYTQTNIAAALNFRITCLKEDPAKIADTKLDDLKDSLTAMAAEAGVTIYGKDASTLEDGTKTSVVIAGGKRPNSEDGKEVVYTGQIWAGKNSVLTLEGDMTGPADLKIEKSYMQILKSVGSKNAPRPTTQPLGK